MVYGLGEYKIENYYSDSEYIERRNNAYASKLQTYVDMNQLSVKDTSRLTKWVRDQKIISIQIYQDGILTYDSDYPQQVDEEAAEEIEYNSWGTYYEIEFSEGVAEVLIFGMYSYQAYTYMTIGGLLLAFALFLLIVMLGIRKSMAYIRKLSGEIEILEGGNLEYEITVTGNDELAALAKGLNDMRKSFCKQVEQETYLVQANQKMITDMSHDLRTPLTSIMIYTEILKKKKYKDEEQMQEYIEKIEQKTQRMKQLSERIFEYSLVTSEMEVALSEPEWFETVFYDLLSETCVYLEQRGYQIELNVRWERRLIQVNPDYLMRILDNIMSNIVKYADCLEPVKIYSVYTEKEARLSFENICRILDKKEESTNIGLRNIKNMMNSMNGKCEVENDGNRFKITLRFPVIQKM
ncbi:HAMP domain-containing histidine kinase [Faecalimonas umbilicata]|nr:HAMP domain-containing histidine kinase [Faecalimonas umbilicata]